MIEDQETQQMVDFFAAEVEKQLVNQFPDKGKPLTRLWLNQFKIHYNNYEHMMVDSVAKRHGINSIFVMAMDDVLCEVHASYSQLKDTVISVYRSMLQEYFDSEAQRIRRSEDPWGTFVEWIRAGNEKNYRNDYFLLEEVPAEGNCYSFNMNRCLYYEILREAGKPELGPILCEYDRILTESFSDWIILRRHETIASGDKHCTFRYCKK
ncbi:MAG: hypothetical protein DRP09_11770 [Candidatus Thorarchaeota archaeon]|nr:MAG: hypothetical protein DRP09_11770 [Candidatus Thorarchaeota archaeon]